MNRISLLAALHPHADQSRPVLAHHLADYVSTPGSDIDALLTSHTSEGVLHLLAQSPNDTLRKEVAYLSDTPAEDLRVLAHDPDPLTAQRAQASLTAQHDLVAILTNDDNLPAQQVLSQLLYTISDVVWMGRIFATSSFKPLLTDYLTSTEFDLPDTFQPGNGSYSDTYDSLGMIIHATGRATLDQMDLTPTQTLLVAALAANQSPNLHAATRAAAHHYQHLLSDQVIDGVLQQAEVHATSRHVQIFETLTMLLNMAACVPATSSARLQQIADVMGRMGQAACHVAEHPNAPQGLRDTIADSLSADHHLDCRRRITGTPDDVHQKAVANWGGDTVDSIHWCSKEGPHLGADTLLHLARHHLDWTSAHWARSWTDLAEGTLDERHIDQLGLNALARLAASAHDELVWQHCNEDSIQMLAAKRLARLLDPIVARHPSSVHLLTNLAELPDTINEFEALIEGINHDQRTISAPARRQRVERTSAHASR